MGDEVSRRRPSPSNNDCSLRRSLHATLRTCGCCASSKRCSLSFESRTLSPLWRQVRDRATFYLSALGAGSDEAASASALPMLLTPVTKPLAGLEAALRAYQAGDCQVRSPPSAHRPLDVAA